MSRDSEVKRQLGAGMPIPSRDISSERFSITRTSNVPEEPKKLNIRVVMGIVMVEDDDGEWRLATPEELEQLTGNIVICWSDNEEGEL